MASIKGYGSMSDDETDRRSADPNDAAARSVSETPASIIAAPRTNDTFLTGVLLLLIVVLLWTSSNFLTNFQLTSGYDKPFAVTYLNTSSFVLYLVPFAAIVRRRRGHENGRLSASWEKMGFTLPRGSLFHSHAAHGQSTAYARLSGADEEAFLSRSPRRRDRLSAAHHRLMRPSSIDGRRPASPMTVSDQHPAQSTQLEPLDLHQTAVLAAQFTIVWFLANYCLNVALKFTSVASASTLSSASGFFTLALGAVAGVEIFTFHKLGAVTMSFFGVLLVTQADSTQSSNGTSSGAPSSNLLAGDLLALASALFYAVYVVLLKYRIGREDRISMPLFFGFVGAFNILAMWPVGLVLHITGVETIEPPKGQLMWAGVVVNMLITVVSDFSYLLAMLKSSPLVATVGLSLTIPLAILGDFILGSHSGGTQSYLGSAIVLLGFVIIGLADRKVAKRQLSETRSIT